MVFETIKTIICSKLDIQPDNVTLESSLHDDLGVDSLDVVELIMTFEEKFDIVINDEAATKMLTVKDIVVYVEKATNK